MTGPLKDLRGQEYRSVHRDDAVVITGAEYLRKTMAEAERNRYREALQRIAALDRPSRSGGLERARALAREALGEAA